jgi:hypothetical protein
MSCLSRSAAFRGGFVFQAGTPPKKERMSLFIRKEDQHSEDRLLANSWFKDYIRRREKVASGQLARRESVHDANKNRCESKMAKIGSPTKRPTATGGFCGDPEEAAPQLVTNRERRNKSEPLAASVPVKFMELRPSMCRWPIGDPKHIETFRFCGSACSAGDIYCKAHTAKAHAPNRPRTPRTTNFQLQHPVRVA